MKGRTVALEGFFILEHVAFVDETLLRRGNVSLVGRGERRLEASDGRRAEVHVEGDLAPRRGFHVDGSHWCALTTKCVVHFRRDVQYASSRSALFFFFSPDLFFAFFYLFFLRPGSKKSQLHTRTR